MLRASRSVTANIAEGFGRHYHHENLQFCGQARGFLIEICDHLNVDVDERLFQAEDMVPYRSNLKSTLLSRNGYLSYLKRCASASKK